MTSKSNPLQQVLYVIEAPTGESKIGIAISAKYRLAQLQGAYARGHARIAFESERHPGNWMIEQSLHAELAAKRLNGEWFDIPADKAVRLVKAALQAGYPEEADFREQRRQRWAKPRPRGFEHRRKRRPMNWRQQAASRESLGGG